MYIPAVTLCVHILQIGPVEGGISAMFAALNRNKRLVTSDAKDLESLCK